MEKYFTDEISKNIDNELRKYNITIELAKIKTDKEKISIKLKALKTLNIVLNSITYNKELLQTFGALIYEILLESEDKSLVFYEKGIESFIKILNVEPFDIKAKESLEILTSAFYNLFDKEISIQILSKVLNIIPESITSNFNIATLYSNIFDIDKSIYHFKLCLELNKYKNDIKNDILIYNSIHTLLFNNSRYELDLKYMEYAIIKHKDDPNINLNIATLYTKLGNKDLAIIFFKIAINNYDKSLISNHEKLLSLIYSNFAFYYTLKPNFELARKYANMSYEINPTINTLSCFLMNLNYDIHDNIMYNTNEHKKVNTFFTRYEPYLFDKQFFNTNKINIGIISGDLTPQHAVNYFISTFINNYNKDKFTLTCYSDNEHGDCKRLKNMTAKQGSDLIYNDKIHILIDLHGHTTYSRLDIFANKPSPIQITWIGYPFTTGLNEMDYRITDNICDNENSQQYYTEKLLFLENCFLCFNPRFLPDINRNKNDKLIIGCFNRPNKMSDKFIEMCNKILEMYPKSELKFNSESFIDSDIFNEFLLKFKNKDRISNIVSPRLINEHLLTYNQVDICLDTFPYSGTTTTCECLSMGVPVLTIYNEDNFHVSNVTASILKNSDLDFYVCSNEDDLIFKLCKIINNEISINKDEIRTKFLTGKVCNQELHVKNLETLFTNLYIKHSS